MSSDQYHNDLASEFNKGSINAFTDIYNALYHQVFLFAKNLIKSDEAQDITAETFFKLWKRHEHFETFANIRAFLYITTRNACLDYIKHQRIKEEKQKEISQLSDKEEKIVIRAEIESEVFQWVRTQIPTLLPPREARIFALAFFEDLKNSEIAQMLEIDEKTVRNAKSSALNKVRLALLNHNFRNGLIALTALALSAFAGLVIFC